MRVVLACAYNSKPSKQQVVLLEPFTRKKWKDGMFEQNQSMQKGTNKLRKANRKTMVLLKISLRKVIRNNKLSSQTL